MTHCCAPLNCGVILEVFCVKRPVVLAGTGLAALLMARHSEPGRAYVTFDATQFFDRLPSTGSLRQAQGRWRPTEAEGTGGTGGKASQGSINIDGNSLTLAIIILVLGVFIPTTQASTLPSLPYSGESATHLTNLPALVVPLPKLAPSTAEAAPSQSASPRRSDESQAYAPPRTSLTQQPAPGQDVRPTIALEMADPSVQPTEAPRVVPDLISTIPVTPPSLTTPILTTPILTTPIPAARPQTSTPTPLLPKQATPRLSLPLDPAVTTALPTPATTTDTKARITAEEPPTVWHVQLLAGRSLDYVIQDKAAFIERYADMLDDLELYITDSGTEREQVFYRLRVAEWETEPGAWFWCSRLKRRGHDCFVARIVLDGAI